MDKIREYLRNPIILFFVCLLSVLWLGSLYRLLAMAVQWVNSGKYRTCGLTFK
jgi:hypothetical protein